MTPLLIEREIQERVAKLAKDIAHDYRSVERFSVNSSLRVVVVMDGAFVFAADLLRRLHHEGMHNLSIEFVKVKTYGDQFVPSKSPYVGDRVIRHVKQSVDYILIIDDLCDTGATLRYLKKAFSPVEVVTCVLAIKKRTPKELVNYHGIVLEENEFVAGYGLDNQGRDRNCPNIYRVGKDAKDKG